MHPSLRPFYEKLKRGEEQRAVMFGDSITFGSQVDPVFDHDIVFHRQWHDALAKRIRGLRLTVENRGVPGNKIAEALARVDNDVLAFTPPLVVVEFGINDCWDGPDRIDEYEQGMRVLVDKLRGGGADTIVFLTANLLNHKVSPEALSLAWFADKTAHAQNAGWLDAYMDRMRRVAHDLALPIADGHARWKAARAAGTDTDLLLANKANHPNREGHRLLAEALLDCFNE